tara:strand:- start:1163 stop:1345 length:183 start_codon:yes stop_codon:yes gene_type:complete
MNIIKAQDALGLPAAILQAQALAITRIDISIGFRAGLLIQLELVTLTVILLMIIVKLCKY